MNGSVPNETLASATIANLANLSSQSKSVEVEKMTNDDAGWVLQCAFMILTMQTGFAMLEGGCVSSRNMANIMIKNVCDVSIGGLAYWLFGYAMTFGKPSNAFIGYGDFAFHESNVNIVGSRFSHYFFQFSFASTATTIVSGAVAERMKMRAYMVFSFFNIVIYAIPAHWCWSNDGFLKKLGFYDFSGSCAVHLNGGASAVTAAWMLGPRMGRFEHPEYFAMSSPSQALTGMFILTWANIVFNSASTFGLSDLKWKLGAVVATCTLNGAIGGGIAGLALSMIHNNGQITVDYIILSMLGGQICMTACSSIVTTYEATVIGALGATTAVFASRLITKLRIDDPVGAIPVHFFSALWGTLAAGIFGMDNMVGHLSGVNGILHGGNGMLLGVNALGALIVVMWSSAMTFVIMFLLDKTMGLRMSLEAETIGADRSEHNIERTPLQRLERTLNEIGEERMNALFNAIVQLQHVDDPVLQAQLGVMARQITNKSAHDAHQNGDVPIEANGVEPKPATSRGASGHIWANKADGSSVEAWESSDKQRSGTGIRRLTSSVVAPSLNLPVIRQRRSTVDWYPNVP